MIVYLDTSAALKLLIEESGTSEMLDAFEAWQAAGDDLVSSYLLLTELHCAAPRRGFADAQMVDALLDGVELIDVDRSHLLDAAQSPRALRSADAVHLVTALAVQADILVAYDTELCAAAERERMQVLRPGR